MIGPFQQAILLVLKKAKAEVTVNAIYATLDGKYAPLSKAAIFIALDRMGKKKLVVCHKGVPARRRGGKAQSLYGLTDDGRVALAEGERVRELLDDLARERPTPRASRTKPPMPRR